MLYDRIHAAWILPDGTRITDLELHASADRMRTHGRRLGTLTHEGFYPAKVTSGRERFNADQIGAL